jgi:hypothetical protein
VASSTPALTRASDRSSPVEALAEAGPALLASRATPHAALDR